MSWDVTLYKGRPNTRLILLMDFKGYTLDSLAAVAQVSPKAIWNMRQGLTYPRLDTVLCICRALGCTADYLYPVHIEESPY